MYSFKYLNNLINKVFGDKQTSFKTFLNYFSKNISVIKIKLFDWLKANV